MVSDLFTLISNTVLDFLTRPAAVVLLDLLALGGYLFLVWLLLYAGLLMYTQYRKLHFTAHWKWVVLAVDMPALNIQTPKAVEQMFAHLAGAWNHVNIAEKFYHGFEQRTFSFEIISIEGYIQFIIRTEETFRELVEAAVYAQYPEAVITEIEDYVGGIPDKFPNETHDIWGADFGLEEADAYPIRSYREFEHNISKDTVLKDPMGTFLESFSRIGAGEQMWFQIVIEPISSHWKEHAMEEVKHLIGEAEHHKSSPILDAISNAPMRVLEGFGDQIFGREASEHAAHEERPADRNQLKFLTPGQVKVVEDIEKKISLIGFKTKMRGLYIARKEVFRPSRGFNALVGAINQFNVPTANSIVPKFTLHIFYFFTKRRTSERKRLLMKGYKNRKMKVGSSPCILNIEELATIWHFPMSHVKTPLLQKAQAKQAEPPAELPVEQFSIEEHLEDRGAGGEKKEEGKKEYKIDAYEYPDDMKFG